MKQPMRTQPQKTTRAMSAVGLLAGDQSEMGAMELRARRSSNFAAVRMRRRSAARPAPMAVRTMSGEQEARRGRGESWRA